VAEGIETNAQWSALRQLEAKKGQGFLFAEPLPASELPEALTRAHSWHSTPVASAQVA
jgi:EAL domain-containing protein (putative c-di-GMP-specific phosphodiesterase class I)